MTTTSLPNVVLNERLLSDLILAKAPCFALGYVEHQGGLVGCFVFRPDETIPVDLTEQNIHVAHSLMTIGDAPILELTFRFHERTSYSGLINPGNPFVQDVLTMMLEMEEYFFFTLNPDNSVMAFRAQYCLQTMLNIKTDLAGLDVFEAMGFDRDCSVEQYEEAVQRHAETLQSPGRPMTWTCRDNADYLDMRKNRLEIELDH